MARLKLNFATRVTVAVLQRSDVSGNAVSERAKLQAQINSNPVRIDRSVFKKSEIEKIELASAKARWKKLNG
jgi:hypothetical protein